MTDNEIEKILVEETRERIRSKICQDQQNMSKCHSSIVDEQFNKVVETLRNVLSTNYIGTSNLAQKPILTVDAIVVNANKEILLIKRKNPPHGWALPGGLVDWGETVETAVIRELLEETSLQANEIKFFKIASEPSRDPRFHAVSIVYSIPEWEGIAVAADDAKEAKWFPMEAISDLEIAFDHKEIIADFFQNYI